MNEVQEFLKNAEYYFLATDEGGQPRVRPFATYAIFEGKLYIQTGKRKAVAKQMLANPKVEICAFKDDKWVRIAADAIEDDRIIAREAVLDQHPMLRELGYKADDGNMLVLYLKNAKATFSTHAGVEKVIDF